MVGTYSDANGVSHGFVWSAGIFTTLDPAGSTATVLQGINDQNQIVGFYTNADNAIIGLMTSIPGPSTFFLLTGGFSALAMARRRRKNHSR